MKRKTVYASAQPKFPYKYQSILVEWERNRGDNVDQERESAKLFRSSEWKFRNSKLKLALWTTNSGLLATFLSRTQISNAGNNVFGEGESMLTMGAMVAEQGVRGRILWTLDKVSKVFHKNLRKIIIGAIFHFYRKFYNLS